MMYKQNNSKRLSAYLRDTAGKEILLVGIGFILVVMAIAVFHTYTNTWWSAAFADYLDPMIALGTLLVAVLIWFNESAENWRATWPKKLHVLYLLKEGDNWRRHITVLDAPLAGESDIRGWGQSIGQTIVPGSTSRIEFTGFKIVPMKADRRKHTKHYGLLVFLKAPITGAEDGQTCIFDPHGMMVQVSEQVPLDHSVSTLFSHIPQP